MSTVTPPPPHIPSAPLSGSVNTVALLLNAPAQTLQALQALQAGQSLQAALASLPTGNTVQVQTALGLLTLQTSLSLPRNATLTLMVSPTASQNPSQISFQISAINGKPVTSASLNAGTAQTAATPATPPLAPGQTITATLLRPALGILQNTPPATAPTQTPGAPTVASTPTLPGTLSMAQNAPKNVPQTASGATPTAIQTAAGPGGITPSVQPSQGGTTQGIPQAATSFPTGTLPAGTQFSITVQNIEAPNAAVTTPVSLAAGTGVKALTTGQVMTGIVTGHTVGGQAIVQTPAATFALGGQSALSEGAKITFRLDFASQSPTPLSTAATAATQLRTLGDIHALISAKSWDDLSEALKALVTADPARLAQVAQNALPQPGAKLSSQMLFFLAALKGGDLKGLFGESALRVIDKERPGLLSRMGADFQTMSRLADEPQQGDWRLALIPLWTGEKLEQLRFFWRGGSGDEGGDEGEETRFVLDMDLSNFGHLQIDGLVKTKRHHLDLIIRTDQPLAAEMRADIGQLFEEARDTLGLSGQVAFQAAPANFIAIPGASPGVSPSGPTPPLPVGLLA